MSNLCYSRITFEGNGEEIRELHECIEKKWAVNVVENRYGIYWLGNMVGNAGLDWENISCRGYIEEISDVEVNDDGSVYFEITTETAWYVMVDMWYEILKKIGFKTISLFYITEEFGCDIFETNDLEKKYYSDKYYVDYLIGSYAATEYLDDDKDLLNLLNKILDTNFEVEKTVIDDTFIGECIELFFDKYDENSDTFTLHKIKYTEK